MLDARADDRFTAPFTPVVGTDAGDWRPLGWPATPAFDPDGWVGNLKTFLTNPSQFRSKGPNALTGAAYAKEFAEVKELGALNSSTRTADQTAAAVFWQFAPIALWNPLARALASRFELDTAGQARLYTLVNLAATDASIACWNDKYYWNFWRRWAAIREADSDGNAATIADPNWESLFASATATTPPLGTPPFPDHPSGHGCLSGAVLQTMARLLRQGQGGVHFGLGLLAERDEFAAAVAYATRPMASALTEAPAVGNGQVTSRTATAK